MTLELSVNNLHLQSLQTTPHTVQQYIGCMLIINFKAGCHQYFFWHSGQNALFVYKPSFKKRIGPVSKNTKLNIEGFCYELH